jgi:pimeloyl-ACP methyl ester carboxylesterase/uncharacterized membrane protein YphA (DoxX/SURF4 family)
MSWVNVKSALIWIVTVLLVLLFFRASGRKFFGVEETVGHFVAWGYPRWLLFTVATIELSGAILLLFPRMAPIGAGLLCTIMIGAAYTHLAHQQWAKSAIPIVCFLLLLLVAGARWPQSWLHDVLLGRDSAQQSIPLVAATIGALGGKPSRRSALGAGEPRSFATLDGVHVAFSDTGGNGPTLICLHAIGHGARDFEGLSNWFHRDYRVIAIDFPGHGWSADDTRPPSATRYAEILSLLVEQLKLESVILLGNSIGGATAIRFAADHPGKVKALVLCNTGGLDPGGKFSDVFRGAFVRFFAAGRRGAPWYPWAFRRYYKMVLPEAAAREQRERIIDAAEESAPLLERAWKSFGEPQNDMRPLLPRIASPVLIAWAENDKTNQLKRCRPAFAAIPRHELVLFTGGHAPFLEDPNRFERTLREFLQKLG